MSDSRSAFSMPITDVVSRLSPIMETAVHTMLRRTLLNAGHKISDVQTLIDCADLAAAAGFEDQARSLDTLVGLRLGCHSEQTRSWPKSASGASAVELAMAELRPIMDVLGDLGPLPHAGCELYTRRSYGSYQLTSNSVATVIHTLHEALHAPQSLESVATLADLLDRFFGGGQGTAPIDLTTFAGADLAVLIDVMILANLQQMLGTVHLFALPPLGSIASLRAIARLDSRGLGAWFGNIGYIVRDSHDLLALPDATAERTLSKDARDRAVILLASGLQGWRLNALAEHLGDLGWTRLLWGLLTIVDSRVQHGGFEDERDTLFTIRDAGLDSGDLPLAAAAQEIVAAERETMLEWRIVGDILASNSDFASADLAYTKALRWDANTREILDRREAARTAAFSPYVVKRGYGQRSRVRHLLRQSATVR